MNDYIQKCRDVAISILKPSQKDLEHGLELHENSLVIDAYAFAPFSAVAANKLNKAVAAGASNLEFRDLCEESQMIRHATEEKSKQEYMDAWTVSGVDCIFQNAGEECQDPLRIMKRLARYTYVTDCLQDFIVRAVFPDDIINAWKKGRKSTYMTSNGIPLPPHWNNIEEELEYIRIFFQLGIRMAHLTYNRRNMIGDGCGEKNDAGLSDFGRTVIKEMNKIGMIIDVAHSGWKTSLEAAQYSEKPIVASHTACAVLKKHCRSKPDNVIKAIADTGGYIGICIIPSFLGGNGNINNFLDHIDYMVKKFGSDYVAIGTDQGYLSQDQEVEQKKIINPPKTRPQWEKLWPDGSFIKCPSESYLSLAWTNWPYFTVGLVQRGYSDNDIRKIISGNILRVTKSIF